MQPRWQDPATWKMVNPNLGRSVDPDFLADQLVTARERGPQALALLASQHFNVEIGVGLGGAWIGAELWGEAAVPGLTLDDIVDQCEVVVAGIDGGGLDDLLGLAVVGRHAETKRWLAWVHAWAHPEVLTRRKEIAPRLMDFERCSDLTILRADEPTGDVTGIGDVIERLLMSGLLPEKGAVGLDPYGVAAIVDELALRGLQDDQLVAVGQGGRLSPAIWGIERKLKNGTFAHCGQPIMDWVMGNARCDQRGGAVMINKETSGRAKIDPLIATLNAFSLMARNPVAQDVMNTYDTRGILVI